VADELSVAVVGLGSRGLSVLERIVTLARRAGPDAGRVRVEIIDPSCGGAGLHATDQPDYLLLNTICSHVSMFPDALSVGADVDEPGPSLYEWVTERGLRVAEDGFTLGRSGRPVDPHDYLPRRILGEYLGWFLDRVLRRVPSHVRVNLHRSAAVDVRSEPDGSLTVVLADGSHVRTGFAFLTTGYTPNDGVELRTPGETRLLAEPWRLPEELARIEPGQTVGIGGFGLTAMDMMAALTVGRGGRFTGSRYVPSGDEPIMLLYSRSGLPHLARPKLNRPGGHYEPVVFSTRTVDTLRGPERLAAHSAQRRRLDFDADVLPLILLEMRIAYHRCRVALDGGPDAEQSLVRALASAWEAGSVEALLDHLDHLDNRDGEHGGFDAVAALDGSAGMALDDARSYQAWLTGFVRDDLAQARLGLAGSPVKAAIDVLRELRDVVRYVVDFGGLTESSLDSFMRNAVPMMNRAVVGPQKERYAELLALVDAGLLRTPFGPDPTVTWNDHEERWRISSTRLATPHAEDVDWVCNAHVQSPSVDSSASPLISALHRKGWIRRHRPQSRQVVSIDLDPDLHPIDVHGRSDRRLWVLGPLCEGTTFYNHLVPSPAVYSRPLSDAHRCVTALFAAARTPAPAPLAPAAALAVDST
jgi:uncharacterized NAD(P)/FAD-binding protein YdhS